MKTNLNIDFWKDRNVLLTGHTGFKGVWMALFLEILGARVHGIALPPNTNPNLYDILVPWKNLESTFIDMRNKEKLTSLINSFNPEIVIHFAAQSLVIESYHNPVDTFEINVMGSLYLLEALRTTSDLKSVLIITSDKVYETDNTQSPFNESSLLGGHDPYSGSKAATEILVSTYSRSFFKAKGVKVCSARTGNVIGGGDWNKNRLVPDLWNAYLNNDVITLRYPNAIRPWQHVLDPLYGYLLYLEKMTMENSDAVAYALNFGPSPSNNSTTQDLATYFSKYLNSHKLWKTDNTLPAFKEANYLMIDATLAKNQLGWINLLDIEDVIHWTCEWYEKFRNGMDMKEVTTCQILSYMKLANKLTVDNN